MCSLFDRARRIEPEQAHIERRKSRDRQRPRGRLAAALSKTARELVGFLPRLTAIDEIEWAVTVRSSTSEQ